MTGLSISDGGFADQLLGTSATKTLTVTNGSGAGQFMGGEQLGGADTTDFAIADPGTCLSHFVANGDSCTFTTSFKPTATGARSGFVAVVPIDGPIDAAIGTLSGRGTTAPVASPPTVLPDTSAPAITLSRVPRTIKLRTLKKRGVVFTVAGNEPIGVDAQMLATARRATLRRGRTTVARAFNLVLAESKQPVAGGARAIRLRPSRRLLGKAKRFKLQVAVSAADAAGNTSTKTRIVKVR